MIGSKTIIFVSFIWNFYANKWLTLNRVINVIYTRNYLKIVKMKE